MKVKIVYFVYLDSEFWYEIVSEQLKLLKDAKLYDYASEINLAVVGDESKKKILSEMLKVNFNKTKISKFSPNNNFEYLGFDELYDSSLNEDCLLLYFHTKGATSNKSEIRKVLEKYTITNFKNYIDAFETNEDLDLGCLIPYIDGFVYFNFFWVKSDYVKSYCEKPKKLINRFFWETWIGNKNCKKHNVSVYSPLNIKPIISYGEYKSTHKEINQIINNLIDDK